MTFCFSYDASCGRGVEIASFTPPPSLPRPFRCGYAGGIGPGNIAQLLARMREGGVGEGGEGVWIDMESR